MKKFLFTSALVVAFSFLWFGPVHAEPSTKVCRLTDKSCAQLIETTEEEECATSGGILFETLDECNGSTSNCFCKRAGSATREKIVGIIEASKCQDVGLEWAGVKYEKCEWLEDSSLTGVTTAQPDKLEPPENLGDLKNLSLVGDIPTLVGRFIRLIMQIIGTIALLMFVYGGVLWMISAGNAEKTKKAMGIMLWASLGAIVILASYAIVTFIFGLVKVK